MPIERLIADQIRKDARRKMVFVGGPRQVGKTTVARRLRSAHETTYLNWDVAAHRARILEQDLGATPLLVLDEIHKYRKWRGYLKGVFDDLKAAEQHRDIVVTGSARLDVYRHGGDSLQGRYHYLRLFPLSVAELGAKGSLADLVRLGGFPEPFFGGSEVEAKRWSRDYRSRLVREDLRDLEQIQDLGTLELMVGRLPALIGSPLSINALREDLQIAHKTASKWLDALERLYGLFRLPPLGGAKIRAVKKEQKLYLFDWVSVTDAGARFENVVALHLLKHCAYRQDVAAEDLELRYFRDTDKREVDFVVTENGAPKWLIEVKLGDQDVSDHLRYLHAKYPKAEAMQLHLNGKKHYLTPDGITVGPAERFLLSLS